MSEAVDGEASQATKEKDAAPLAAASASVQATVTAPDAPDAVNLTVKAEAPASVVVAAAAVNPVHPEEVKLTAVPGVNPSTALPNQPTVTNQPTVMNQPAVPATQPTVTSPAVASAAEKERDRVSTQPSSKDFRPQPDDFYRTIFYFSGMGRVIGSALAEGVYVDEKNRRSAIDPDEVERHRRAGGEDGRKPVGGELITTARNQAVNLSADFRRLQSLLETLPTFTDAATTPSSSGGGVRVDEPIHGEIYFRSERPEQYQQQQLASQRMRQAYIIDHSPLSIYQQQNGHLIDVPWNYQNNY